MYVKKTYQARGTSDFPFKLTLEPSASQEVIICPARRLRFVLRANHADADSHRPRGHHAGVEMELDRGFPRKSPRFRAVAIGEPLRGRLPVSCK